MRMQNLGTYNHHVSVCDGGRVNQTAETRHRLLNKYADRRATSLHTTFHWCDLCSITASTYAKYGTRARTSRWPRSKVLPWNLTVTLPPPSLIITICAGPRQPGVSSFGGVIPNVYEISPFVFCKGGNELGCHPTMA